MDISKNITIHLSENDIAEIISEFLKSKGYAIQPEQVRFDVGRGLVGYGMDEHEEIYFKGAHVNVED